MGPAAKAAGAFVHAGLDVADTGADKNSLVGRAGPELFYRDDWSGSAAVHTGKTATRAHHWCVEHGASRLYYDLGGPGAGVRAKMAEIQDRRTYDVHGVHFGGAVAGADVRYTRGERKSVTNGEYFGKRRDQLGWNVRLRATQTTKLLDGEEVDPSRCLFINPEIPRIEDMLAQCAQPEWNDDTGKLSIDKQPREPGEPKPPSPDDYDATIQAFASDSARGLRRAA